MQMQSPISVGRSPKTIPGSSYTLKVAHYYYYYYYFINIKEKKSNIPYYIAIIIRSYMSKRFLQPQA